MTELADGSIAQSIHMVLIGHITNACEGALPDLICNAVSRFAETALMKIADQNLGAFLGGTLGRRKADSCSRSSGDDDGFILQQISWFGICGNAHVSPLGSRGMPRARSAIILRWIWLVPP